MLDEIQVHEIEVYLPPNMVRKIEETDKTYLQRLLSTAKMNIHVTENRLSNHSNHLVRQCRSQITGIIGNELLDYFHKIGSKWSNEEAALTLRSGRLESDRIANVNGEVFFLWYILIQNPFEYLFCTCKRNYFN